MKQTPYNNSTYNYFDTAKILYNFDSELELNEFIDKLNSNTSFDELQKKDIDNSQQKTGLISLDDLVNSIPKQKQNTVGTEIDINDKYEIEGNNLVPKYDQYTQGIDNKINYNNSSSSTEFFGAIIFLFIVGYFIYYLVNLDKPKVVKTKSKTPIPKEKFPQFTKQQQLSVAFMMNVIAYNSDSSERRLKRNIAIKRYVDMFDFTDEEYSYFSNNKSFFEISIELNFLNDNQKNLLISIGYDILTSAENPTDKEINLTFEVFDKYANIDDVKFKEGVKLITKELYNLILKM